MATTIAPEAHEHVVHLKVSWATYETLVADTGDDRHALLSYDGETLDIANATNVGFLDKIDPGTSPPPDLVVEIDMSRSRMDKFALYSTIGVPEFWRIDREGLRAFTVTDGVYAAIDVGIVIPGLPISELGRFLERRLEPDRRAIYKDWQAWLREHRHLQSSAL
jgi:hypothetical protein